MKLSLDQIYILIGDKKNRTSELWEDVNPSEKLFLFVVNYLNSSVDVLNEQQAIFIILESILAQQLSFGDI